MNTTHSPTTTEREGVVVPGLSTSDHAWLVKMKFGKHEFAKSLLARRCAAGISLFSEKHLQSATKQAGVTMPFFNEMATIGMRPSDPVHEAGLEWAFGYPQGKATTEFEDQAATLPLPPEQYVEALEHYVGAWAYTLLCLTQRCAEGLELYPANILTVEVERRGVSWSEYIRLSHTSLTSEMEEAAEGWEILNNSGRCPSYFIWAIDKPKWIEV